MLFVNIVQLTCSIDESFKRLLMVTPDATSKLLRRELSNTPRRWNLMDRDELSTSYQFLSLSMLCSSYPKPKSRNIRPRTLEFYVGDSGDAQVDTALLAKLRLKLTRHDLSKYEIRISKSETIF